MPRPDGTFGVVMEASSGLYWYACDSPPDLGLEVSVVPSRTDPRPGITALRPDRIDVLATKASRRVAPEWSRRVVEAIQGRTLRDYQIDGAAWLASKLANGRGGILADEQGLGKSTETVVAIVASNALPAIIVCPTSLKLNWEREAKWSSRPLSVDVLRGRIGPVVGADLTIVNYQLLRYREEQLANMGARCIAFDEAQELKEPRPRLMHQAAVATRLAHHIGRAALLTGTPIMNRPKELWRLLHIVDPDAWPTYEAFRARYCRQLTQEEIDAEGDPRRAMTAVGRVERVDELRVLSAPSILRRLKSEVATDLPSKRRHPILIQLNDYDMAHYAAAKADVAKWLHDQGQIKAATVAVKNQMLVKLTHLRHLAARGKMREFVPQYLRRWFSDSDEPLVIFAHHVDIVKGTVSLLQSMNVEVSWISGDMDDRKRQAAVDSFMSGKANAFVAPIKSGGVGLNLQRAAETLFLERSWVPKALEQAEDRVHRIGQTRPVTATYIDAANTIDEYIAETLDAKTELIGSVVSQDDDEFRVAEKVSEMFSRC